MADKLRTVAVEGALGAEGVLLDSGKRGYRTEQGKAVAGVLQAEADKDVYTALQLAAGEQLSPKIIRTNIDAAIGIIKPDGTIDHAGGDYAVRYARADEAMKKAEIYFDDQKAFKEFKASAEGIAVIDNVGKFLMTHPALAEYFNVYKGSRRLSVAKELAEKYLKDPFAREKIRQSLLASGLNKGTVNDELSTELHKRDELDRQAKELEAKKKKLAGDPAAAVPTDGEVATMQKRRREFDRYSDDLSTVEGTEFKGLQAAKSTIALLDSEIKALERKVTLGNDAIKTLTADKNTANKIILNSKVPAIDPADIQKDINSIKDDITKAGGWLEEIQTKEKEKAAKQAEVEAIESERKQLEETIKAKVADLDQVNGELTRVKKELGEQNIKMVGLKAGKARTEELAVVEIENIFKKGIEEEMISRLESSQEAAEKLFEEAAARETDNEDRKYRELRVKRHKNDDGRINETNIKEDFIQLMQDATEYKIVQHSSDPNKVDITDMPAGGWPAGTSAGEVYYLNGPEVALIRMMDATSEFGGKYMLSKLKDRAWLATESQDFASQVIREKTHASRGWFKSRKTGVKGISPSEAIKIKNSTWGIDWMESSLQHSQGQMDELNKVFGGGVPKDGEGLKEWIRRRSGKDLLLLMLLLGGLGAIAGPGGALLGASIGGAGGLGTRHAAEDTL